MNYDVTKIPLGSKFPEEINIIIEIPAGKVGIKYEVCKETGMLAVDRFLSAPMFYPAHYGFVPQTLGGDGDPIDVLVIAPFDLIPGCTIMCRPLGVLLMTDEKGTDEKIIAIPTSDVAKGYGYEKYQNITDLDEMTLNQIKHFFEHYKDLEKGKWVKIQGFGDAKQAKQILQESAKNNK